MKLTVTGRFWSIDPWWEVTLNVGHNSRKHKYAKGYPSYKLRSDAGVLQEKLVLLFLQKCGVAEQHRNQFYNCIANEMGHLEMLTFEHFEDLLQQYGDMSKENGEVAESINKAVSSSCKMLRRCHDFSELFVYLPQLLPKKFARLMDLNAETIACLHDALQDEPWIFGFAPIMAYRFKLYGCEARLQNLADCGLLDQFPETEKDALHIYTQLKNSCTRFGHTYNKNDRLFQDVIKYQQYQITWKRMEVALEYLESNYIIHISKENGVTNIFLRSLWKAEQTIVKHLSELLRQHKEDPCQIELDFTSEDFKHIRTDDDQLRAAERISTEAVTVLSGRGGCGKTTVVSKVCMPAEEQILAQADKMYAERMFEESAIDDITLSQAVDKAESMKYEDIPCSSSSTFCLSPSSTATQSQGGTRRKKKKRKKKKARTQRQIDLGSDAPDSEPDEKEEEDPRKEYPVVLLTAPTGKAANLLGKRAKLSSFTLHQVIYSYRKWKNECREAEEEGKPTPLWKFYRVTVLVVDECSLVSVTTFSAMLDMLMSEAKIRKLVLLGDILQLPSVEPGNFLSDTFQAMDRIGCSVMLRTNHRSDCELITANAGRIASQRYPDFSEEGNFIKKDIDGGSLIVGPHCSKDDHIQNDQDSIVKRMLTEMNLDQESSQFVAFRRNDCNSINEICCQHYVHHSMKNCKNKFIFEIGDKVCCTKNANVKNKLDNTTVRLCNGEIFFVKDDVREVKENGRKKRYLQLYDPESEAMLKVNFSLLRHECKLRHAWARTIHTYQGSESEIVVYVVGRPAWQTWQHVYTAVTRGRKRVILITSDPALHKAIDRRPYKRLTGLKADLEKRLGELFGKLQPASISIGTPRIANTPRFRPTSQYVGNHNSARKLDLPASPQITEDDQNETKNDSQFSDWGDSFTDEVTRLEVKSEDLSQYPSSAKEATDFKLRGGRSDSSVASTSTVREEMGSRGIPSEVTKTDKSVHRAASEVNGNLDNLSCSRSNGNATAGPESQTNSAKETNIDDTFDDISHVLDDESFSPTSSHLSDDESFSPYSSQATQRMPQYSESAVAPEEMFSDVSCSGDSVSNLYDIPTQLYRQTSNDSDSDHEDLSSSPDNWTMPPGGASDAPSMVHTTPPRSRMRGTTPPGGPSDAQSTAHTTPPSSQTRGTPKREATSPVRGQKTPAKQQRLPSTVENSVKVTPVRNVFENLSTN